MLSIPVWVLWAYFFQNSLSVYSTQTYQRAIVLSSFALLCISLFRLIFESRKFLKNVDVYRIKSVFKNRYLQIFFLFSLAAVFVNRAFLIFGFLLMIFYKNISQEKNESKKLTQLKDLPLVFLTFLVSVFGIIFPSSSISVAVANQRAYNLNTLPPRNSNVSISDFFATNTLDFSIGDWVSILNQNTDHLQFINQEVKVEGFVYRPHNLPQNLFLISRFVVRCCAADATPIGLPVLLGQSESSLYRDGQWLRVQGIFDYDRENDFLYIKPQLIEQIEPLTNPYVY